MTIEQLEKANKIYENLKIMQDVLDAQEKYILSEWVLDMGDIKLRLKDLPGIKVVIRDYTSDRITELEKQLEELCQN